MLQFVQYIASHSVEGDHLLKEANGHDESNTNTMSSVVAKVQKSKQQKIITGNTR